MRIALVACLIASVSVAVADDARAVLFDFEDGVQGWFGNPWGGGECEALASDDAKYGVGALTCAYVDIQKGANAVGPDLPENAPWRDREWGGLSLWLKGDGSPAKIRIQIETTQDRSPEQPGGATFTVDTPLEDASWHRVQFAFSRFWSREKLRIDSSKIRRVFIGAGGTREFQIDQVALESPGRTCWLDADPDVQPGPMNEELSEPAWTALGDGRLELRMDVEPLRDRGNVKVRVNAQVGGHRMQGEVALAGGAIVTQEMAHVFPLELDEDAIAETTVEVEAPEGTRVASWGHTFPMYGPEPELVEPPIAIYPVPKEIERREGVFRFGDVTRVRVEWMSEEDTRRTVGLFAREMAEYYGKTVELVEEGKPEISVVVGRVVGTVSPQQAEWLNNMGDEGYILQVRPDGIRLRTHEAKGVYYGIQALLAAIDDETTVPSEAAAPCCQIGDWPTFPFRGISCANPTNRWGYPNDPSYEVGDFNDFIYRTVARLKMNKVVFIVPEGMQFDSHPELSAPNAWSKDELRQFVDFAREHYIEVIPLVTVLGHASWFTVTHKELVEPANDHNIACVRLPETNALIADVMAEVVEVFEPEMVHLGMDECWWKTLDKPEEERCPRCGEDWPQIVAQQATFFHDLLAEKGIRTMMWDDMLLPEHNGGAPYHTARALGGIPTDMVITNWSAGLAPNSSKRFADAGLTVIRSNSHGIPRAEAPYVIGNMMGLWSKIPWLTDTYHKTSATYSYLALPQAAEFSWNVDPKLTSRGIDRDMLAERADSVMRRIALQPSPNVGAEQTAIDLTEAFNGDAKGLSALDDGETEIAGVGFEVTDEAVTVADDPVTVPVGAEAAEIDLLVSCDLARGEWEEFTKRFREKDGNLGVLIGTVEFALSDGTTEALELRYGHNVLPWDRDLAAPYLYGAIGSISTTGASPQSNAYVIQWVNPRPDASVDSLTVRGEGTEAVVMVLAATRR